MTIPTLATLPLHSSLPVPGWRRQPRHSAVRMSAAGHERAGDGIGNPTEAVTTTDALRRSEIRMASPGDTAFTEALVQVVAANLAAGGMASGRFAIEMASLRRHLLAASCTPPEPIYQALSIAILCRRDPRGAVRSCDIARMDTVYALMCRRRWWITIAQDLPLAALLAGVNAPAEHIDHDCECSYAGLLAHGYAVGLSAQIAACVLCLLPIPQAQAFHRFLALVHAMRRSGISDQLPPAELSVLCLLDQDPERIALHYRGVRADLGNPEASPSQGSREHMPAIERTFMEILPADRSLGGLSARAGRQQHEHLVRDFLACSCVVAMASVEAQAFHAA